MAANTYRTTGLIKSAATGAVNRVPQDKWFETVSVKDFGAVGDWNGTTGTDDTAALQAAIDTRKPLYWPAGSYRITSTLTIPNTSPQGGGRWIGDAIDGSGYGSGRVGPATSIVWDGAASGTMIVNNGARGLVFSDIVFYGATTAGILYHCTTNVSAGSGSFSVFNHCVFDSAVVGVQYGVDVGDTNCDLTTFRDCIFYDLTQGFLCKHGQGLSFLFENLTAQTVKTVIRFEQGGHLTINHAHFGTVGGDGADEWAISLEGQGSQSYSTLITNLRVEQSSKKILRVAETFQGVHLKGFHEGQLDQNAAMFQIRGAYLHIEDACFTTKNALTFDVGAGPGSVRSVLKISNSNFMANTFKLEEWCTLQVSVFAVVVRDCTFGVTQHRPLPDICNSIEYGPVQMKGQTTNATPRNLHFDGAATLSTGNRLMVPLDSVWDTIVSVIAVNNSDSAVRGVFKRRVIFQDVAGTATLVGTAETIGTDYNPDSLAIAFAFGTQFMRVNVTGIAATTLDWRVVVHPMGGYIINTA